MAFCLRDASGDRRSDSWTARDAVGAARAEVVIIFMQNVIGNPHAICSDSEEVTSYFRYIYKEHSLVNTTELIVTSYGQIQNKGNLIR